MALPPPQPAYVFRGHAAQVHALEFSPTNANLVSGDADGYVICWSLSSKRAIASWQAHTNAVLAVAWWTDDILVTHGRDSQLYFWKLHPGVDAILPVDKHANPEIRPGKKPTLCHSMTVNTLNFCAFTWTGFNSIDSAQSYLLALPHTLSSEAIDIFHVTMNFSEIGNVSIGAVRRTTIPAPELNNPKTGLTMCLAFARDDNLLAGYESGHTIVYHRSKPTTLRDEVGGESLSWKYQPSYISRPHSQPVLSIQSIQERQIYITTAADSKLVTHRIPAVSSDYSVTEEREPLHVLDTKHSGQQGLSARDDGLLLATAGWDSKGRVYKSPLMKEGHTLDCVLPPKELAVLKWHKEGCYSTAFAHIQRDDGADQYGATEANIGDEMVKLSLVNDRSGQIETATKRRDREARSKHWLALGSKDGKISLWDIF